MILGDDSNKILDVVRRGEVTVLYKYFFFIFYFFFFGRGGGGGGGVFTTLSRIFHLYRADHSSKVGENRRTRGNT